MGVIPEEEERIRPTDPKLNGNKIAVWMCAGATPQGCEQHFGKKMRVDFDCYIPIFVEAYKGESNRPATYRGLNEIASITILYGYDLKYVQDHMMMHVIFSMPVLLSCLMM